MFGFEPLRPPGRHAPGRASLTASTSCRNTSPNGSGRSAGTAAQAILMSIYRTLRLRGLNPNKTIAAALRTYLTSGQLPPLPDAPTADG